MTSNGPIESINKYIKSYERECISWYMGTSDVLKVLKLARAGGDCNLRTFKTSRVTINHEMHEQLDTIFYLLYSKQNYSNALLCTRYVLHKTFQWFPICSHVLFETIRNIMLWRNINFWRIWKNSRKLNFQLFKGGKSSQICFQFFNLNRPQWFTDFGELHCPWTHVKCNLTVVKVVHGESMAACVHLLRRWSRWRKRPNW